MRILIVDDDLEMCGMLENLLKADGYEVESASTATEALESLARTEPDLVLLDVVLEDQDGRDLLREMRMIGDVPVIFLTGRGSEMDRIAGLKLGADDYVVKPFSPGELSARVATVLRRAARSAAPSRTALVFGDLKIDETSREVHVRDELVPLTAREFDLLAFLANSPRQVFSRRQLLELVWESSGDWQDEATITEHIRRVRRKIEADPDHPRRITTVRGVGYRFEPN